MVLFPVTYNGPIAQISRSRPSPNLFDAEYLKNGTRYSHSYNGILIGTCLIKGVILNDIEFRVILSDLVTYSMTQSIVRPLCDS